MKQTLLPRRESKKAQEWVGMELQPGPVYAYAKYRLLSLSHTHALAGDT